MVDYMQYFTERQASMVATLRELAAFESPSTSKTHVDLLGEHVAGMCRAIGGEVTTIPREAVGDVRVAQWNANAPGKPIMLLGHLDTVWPVGTLADMPIREEDGILYGPGVIDMKGSLTLALEAIRCLHTHDALPPHPIWFFFNSDEETGSVYTRDLIKDWAGRAGLVLVLEPATPEGAIKIWRKGIGRYTLRITGRAAHSGFAPEEGINALIEAAHQSLAIHALNDLRNGTSVSVTQLSGGMAINVIPPSAEMTMDLRYLKASEGERVDAALRDLVPVLPGAQIELGGGIDRGPMEYDAQMERVFGQAQQLAAKLGFELHGDGSGGASDGNFTAAMGIPTLDGMGPAGRGLHAADEQVFITSMPRRAALLAIILAEWDMAAV
ncbi:MAG: M20 family metallopeptidase [Chloroflexi bacterium]|nr:M20 family metallopeptidase [Chloroflexota bacterium]